MSENEWFWVFGFCIGLVCGVVVGAAAMCRQFRGLMGKKEDG